jgi:hypothetical protein
MFIYDVDGIDETDKVKTEDNVYETETLVNIANLRRFAPWTWKNRLQPTSRREYGPMRLRGNLPQPNLVNMTNFAFAKNSSKRGAWPSLPNVANFVVIVWWASKTRPNPAEFGQKWRVQRLEVMSIC